ncbi:MAG: nitrate/nitrite transporter NrtS [Rhodocyclaceae bacterium]|nr:nitrate/nitrite transporter NrtS [Rhodocyclaceae bacterium]
MLDLIKLACRPRTLRTSALIALVVGSLLNLINQGDRLLSDMPLDWGRMLLNFLVPFCVASISAALNASARKGTRG